MPHIVSETNPPRPRNYVHEYERGLDPWHPESFIGTPMEGRLPTTEPRAKGWYFLDYCGNVIGWMPDGHDDAEKQEIPVEIAIAWDNSEETMQNTHEY